MNKKILAFCLAIFLPLSFFSGCSDNKALNIAYPVAENVRTLDPQFATSTTAETIAINCFEGLIGVDENGEYIPAAAQTWRKDGLIYTFQLRQDAKWTLSKTAKDGMKEKLPADFSPAVTAHDFVFAFRRLADPATKAPSAYLYQCIKGFSDAVSGGAAVNTIGVTAESDYVLKIELQYDDPNFYDKLLLPAAMPCNETFFNACGGRYGLMTKYIMTNGAFYFARWNTDTSIRIAADTEYTGARKAQPETVWFYINDDPSALNRKLAEAVYTAGNTCLAPFAIDALDEDLTAESYDDAIWALLFNCKSAVPAVKSLRTALTASINRDYFQAENQSLTSGMLPKTVQAAAPQAIDQKLLPPLGESTAKASLTAALTELDTSRTEITVLCTAEFEPALKRQMQGWQKTLGVAIAVRIQTVAENELLAAAASGDYEAIFYPIKAESPSLLDFLQKFTTGSTGNLIGFSSAEYDAIFAEACRAATRDALADAENRALQYLADNSVYYPVYYKSSYFVHRTDVTGIYRYGKENMLYFSQAHKN